MAAHKTRRFKFLKMKIKQRSAYPYVTREVADVSPPVGVQGVNNAKPVRVGQRGQLCQQIIASGLIAHHNSAHVREF